MGPFYSIENVRNFVKAHGRKRLVELAHTSGALSRTELGFVKAYYQALEFQGWQVFVLKVFPSLWPVATGLTVALLSYTFGWL